MYLFFLSLEATKKGITAIMSRYLVMTLTHFQPMFHFYTPDKRKKISGGIEVENHWLQMALTST